MKKKLLLSIAPILAFHLTIMAGGPGSGRHKEHFDSGSGGGLLLAILIIIICVILLIAGVVGAISKKIKIKRTKTALLKHIDDMLSKKELNHNQWSEIKNNVDIKGLAWTSKYIKELTEIRIREEKIEQGRKKRKEEMDNFIAKGDLIASKGDIDELKWNQLKTKEAPNDLLVLTRMLDQLITERKREKEIGSFIADNEGLPAQGIIMAEHWKEIMAGIDSKGLSWAKEMLGYSKDIKQRYDGLIRKYGQDKGAKIFNKEFFIGMTKQELIDSNGEPTKVEHEVLKTKIKETWIYGNKSSGDVFVFENEVLTRFKDR